MKTYGGEDVKTHIFLTSAIIGGEWSASSPGRYTLGEKASDTHWTGSENEFVCLSINVPLYLLVI
jgi:hypothetical protein